MSSVLSVITKVNCGGCDRKKLTCTYDLSYTFNGNPKTGSVDADLSCGTTNLDEQPKKVGDNFNVDVDSNGDIVKKSLPLWARVLLCILFIIFICGGLFLLYMAKN